MSDWLSEIEDVDEYIDSNLGDDTMDDIMRMARVIRELAECLETFEGSLGEWSVESCVAFSNLSPDAKELLG